MPVQLAPQQHQQPLLITYSPITATPYTSGNLAITLSNHHAQFLIMENQPNLSESKKEGQLCCDFQEIEKNKIIISKQLQNVDWESELRLECNNINLSSELLINKVDLLINV